MKRFFRVCKTAVSALLCAAIGFCCLPVSAAASPAERVYKGNFLYSTFESADGVHGTYYYSDSYFLSSGKETNAHLRSMSAVMAFGVSHYSQEQSPAQGITEILTDIGFDTGSIVAQDMNITTKDSIGTVIAHKEINGMPLICVALRGNGYNSEWASNVTAGTEGDPKGFSDSADKVMRRINQYIEDYSLSSPKFWVMGYSRAGAVSNLVGRRLNENISAYGITDDDIYVYTFEAANSSADPSVYENIHNVVDINDLVPYVYPSGWGISVNGVKEYIGGEEEMLTSKTFDLRAKDFTTDSKKVSKSKFLSQFTEFLGENLSRETYVSLLEEPASKLCEIIFGKPAADQDAISNYFDKVFENAGNDAHLVMIVMYIITGPESEFTITSVSNFLKKHMDDTRTDENPPFTDEEYEFLKSAVEPFVRAMMKLVDPELAYSEKDSNGNTIKMPFYHLMTFAEYSDALITAHYNTHLFEVITAQDSYYSDSFSVTPGALFCGQRYTFDDYGEGLYSKAEKMGFSERDIRYLRNGYDVGIDNDVKTVSGSSVSEESKVVIGEMIGKTAETVGYYDITLNKRVGFRVDTAKTEFAENTVTMTLDSPPSKDDKIYVIYADGRETAVMESSLQTESDKTSLTFKAPRSGVYTVVRSKQPLSLPASRVFEKNSPTTWVILSIAVLVFFFAAFFVFKHFEDKKQLKHISKNTEEDR